MILNKPQICFRLIPKPALSIIAMLLALFCSFASSSVAVEIPNYAKVQILDSLSSAFASLTLQQSFDEEKFKGTLEFEFASIEEEGDLLLREVKAEFDYQERRSFSAEQLVRGEKPYFLEKIAFGLKPYGELKIADLPSATEVPLSFPGKMKLYVSVEGENRRFIDDVLVRVQKLTEDPLRLTGHIFFGKSAKELSSVDHPLEFNMAPKASLMGRLSFNVSPAD